eukprot:scaffold58791_cov62-Phaeocystis_antarctica.AAC.2
MGPRARAKGDDGWPRRAPPAPQTATAGAFGAGEASDEITVWGKLPSLGGSHRALRTCSTSTSMDLCGGDSRPEVKANHPPALIRPANARSSSGRPPASASLGQSADTFRLAGHTSLAIHIAMDHSSISLSAAPPASPGAARFALAAPAAPAGARACGPALRLAACRSAASLSCWRCITASSACRCAAHCCAWLGPECRGAVAAPPTAVPAPSRVAAAAAPPAWPLAWPPAWRAPGGWTPDDG